VKIQTLWGVGANSNWGFSLLFALMAAFALSVLAVAVLNPKRVIDKYFEFGRKYFRIGWYRFGVWNQASSSRQFRIQFVIYSVLMASLCIFFAILFQ
jgi:hypothetical protein